MNAAEIRSRFLEFFAQKGHTVVPSSSANRAGSVSAAGERISRAHWRTAVARAMASAAAAGRPISPGSGVSGG